MNTVNQTLAVCGSCQTAYTFKYPAKRLDIEFFTVCPNCFELVEVEPEINDDQP